MRYEAESFVIYMSISLALSTPWLCVLRTRCGNCNRHQQRLRNKLAQRRKLSWVWSTMTHSNHLLSLLRYDTESSDPVLSHDFEDWSPSLSLITFFLSLSNRALSHDTIDLIVFVFEERWRALRELNLGFKYGSGLGNIQTIPDYFYPWKIEYYPKYLDRVGLDIHYPMGMTIPWQSKVHGKSWTFPTHITNFRPKFIS